TTYEAAYRSAQARLANADRTLARLKPLLAARAVARKDVDDAQHALDQAQAAADQTKKDYEDTFVRAEISGRAGRAQLELGARVTGPGDLLTTVEQVDPIYVNFSPSDEDLLGLRRDIADGRLLMPPAPRALAVQVTLADGSLLPAAGELNFADLALQPATGTLQLRAQLKNPQHVLLPGQFVRVRLLGLKRPSAILVPQRAVQQGLTGAFVYLVGDSDKVAARNVVASSWEGGSWLIEQGLHVGDRVVVDGVQKVAPGQPARPVAYRPAPNSAAAGPQDSALIAPPAAPLRLSSGPDRAAAVGHGRPAVFQVRELERWGHEPVGFLRRLAESRSGRCGCAKPDRARPAAAPPGGGAQRHHGAEAPDRLPGRARAFVRRSSLRHRVPEQLRQDLHRRRAQAAPRRGRCEHLRPA